MTASAFPAVALLNGRLLRAGGRKLSRSRLRKKKRKAFERACGNWRAFTEGL